MVSNGTCMSSGRVPARGLRTQRDHLGSGERGSHERVIAGATIIGSPRKSTFPASEAKTAVSEQRPLGVGRHAKLLDRLGGGLIVSCQAPLGHPLRDSGMIARLAVAADLGGAVAVRVNSTEDIRAVKDVTDLPVIGIYKVGQRNGRDLITPRLELVTALAAAGADVIALEATAETPSEHDDPTNLLRRVCAELDLPVMADVATIREGFAAWQAGADLVATTLSGYTAASTQDTTGPDLDLVASLSAYGARTVGEGRYRTPEQVKEAFDRGAFAVVVGGAITDPVAITRRFTMVVPAGTADPVSRRRDLRAWSESPKDEELGEAEGPRGR
jgi:N-acylglucosamine-6-phosphate 2-epimerase